MIKGRVNWFKYMDLSQKKCVPCEVKIPPLAGPAVARHAAWLKTPWEVIDNKKIQRQFKFKDFKEAVQFVNKVAGLAEREGHHPDIHVLYNKVVIELETHFIGGLSENDFIMAAKMENL